MSFLVRSPWFKFCIPEIEIALAKPNAKTLKISKTFTMQLSIVNFTTFVLDFGDKIAKNSKKIFTALVNICVFLAT